MASPHRNEDMTANFAGDPQPNESHEAVEDLRGEMSRGQTLDHQLARDLGRPVTLRSISDGSYVASLGRRPTLPESTERRLVEAAKAGDGTARAQLIEAYMPLINAAARTYRSGQVQRLELLQEGVVGVLRALERFDPDRGIPFWGYATWWVRQAMQQLVSELTRPVVLSDRALRHLARLKQAHYDAFQFAGRQPGRAELAERCGLSLEQVDALLATERAPRALEQTRDDSEIGTFGELLIDPLAEDEYERVLTDIEVEELHTLLACLSDRERTVLQGRYGLDDGQERSLRQIGDQLGLSAERVRQIERRALSKLANAFNTNTPRPIPQPRTEPATPASPAKRTPA